MKEPPTLADGLIRSLLRPKLGPALSFGRKADEVRHQLNAARRFVLDDKMSGFLADLAHVPFDVAPIRRPSVMDTLRYGAMPPHKVTWIEFRCYHFRKRLKDMEALHQIINTSLGHDVYGQELAPPEEVPCVWGWLIEQHPQIPTCVMLTECGGDHVDGRNVPDFVAPFSLVWNTVDTPLPWKNVDFNSGMLAHGITGFVSPYMGVVYHKGIPAFANRQVRSGELSFVTHALVAEFAGTLRYALALLATLNDVPVIKAEVKPSHGYVARGSYRKFLEHTIIRLNIPAGKDVRIVAKRAVGQARRRAHQVRGHWRLYQRGDLVCDHSLHEWGPNASATDREGKTHVHGQCLRCTAWRTWIDEHQRGDDRIGLVIHDYALTHEVH